MLVESRSMSAEWLLRCQSDKTADSGAEVGIGTDCVLPRVITSARSEASSRHHAHAVYVRRKHATMDSLTSKGNENVESNSAAAIDNVVAVTRRHAGNGSADRRAAAVKSR